MNINISKKTDTYEQIRTRLLFSSYVLNTLVSRLREKYNIQDYERMDNWAKELKCKYHNEWEMILNVEKLKSRWKTRAFQTYYPIIDLYRIAAPEVPNIATKLSIDEKDLFVFLVTKKVRFDQKYAKGYPSALEDVYQVYGSSTTMEDGVYIKIRANTRMREINERVKLAKGLLVASKYNDRKRVNKPAKLMTYLSIENKLLKKSKHRLDSYKNALFTSALDEVVDEYVEDFYPEKIDDDGFNDKQKTMIKNSYYDVTKTFNLPTYSDLEDLLGLLRH